MFEISKLKELKLSELQVIAEKLSISKFKSLKKLDLVYKILDHQASFVNNFISSFNIWRIFCLCFYVAN